MVTFCGYMTGQPRSFLTSQVKRGSVAVEGWWSQSQVPFIKHLLQDKGGDPCFPHFVFPPPKYQWSKYYYLSVLFYCFLQVNKLAEKIEQPEGHQLVRVQAGIGTPTSGSKKQVWNMSI